MPSTFPTLSGIVYPVKRGPVWSTERHRSVSGKRTTLAWYSYPYYRYEVGFSFLRQADAHKEWQELVSFYNTVNGPAIMWLWNDPVDNTATAQSFGTGDGSTTTFQLLRRLTGSTFTWNDPVFQPVAGLQVFKNGVLQTLGVDYTVGDTGIITFTAAPGAGVALTWTGTYKWPCRFDEDYADFENFAYHFWDLKSLKFSTEKL